jgi:hypothetical protein
MPEDELSVHESVATDPVKDAMLTDKFRAQRYSSERLHEYYNQVVAEIRASLDGIQDEGGEREKVADRTSQ